LAAIFFIPKEFSENSGTLSLRVSSNPSQFPVQTCNKKEEEAMRTRTTKRRNRPWRGALFGGALLFATLLGISTVPGPVEASQSLGGSERFLAHVSTDKPIYRAGESVILRTMLLSAFNNKPHTSNVVARLEIKSARDETLVNGSFQINQGSGGIGWIVPEGTPGGEYTAKVSFPNDGYTPAERKFEVRAYHTPRLRTQLEFLNKAYGPGDTVTATLQATRSEGGIPEDAKVTAIARIDGDEVWRGETQIDANGRTAVQFDLPEKIENGVGSLTLVIEDGGAVQSAVRTLPILLQNIPMQFYAEGGDLIAGLENGLYVQAKTPWGDPADVKAEIVTADGKTVGEFKTTHEGRGRTTFTPEAGESYFARIIEPAGITALKALPRVKDEGAVLRAVRQGYDAHETVDFHVSATKEGSYALALHQRENIIGIRRVDLKAGETQTVSLTPADNYEGVLRATLFDAEDNPMAERLVFRNPKEQLNIEVVASPEHAVPGDKVELTIRTTNSKGEPVSALVALTVTDDAVLEMIQTRRQAPRLPAMVLLENEVDDLKDAHIYLSQDSNAQSNIDLLLGTQGWRRFAYIDPAEFMKEHEDNARRVLAFRREIRRRAVGLGGGIGGGAGAPRPGRAQGGAAPRRNDADAPVEDAMDAAPEAGPEGEALRDAPAQEAEAEPERAQDATEAREADARLARRAPESRRRVAPRAIALREYAHQLREDRQPGDRRDFTETVYWNAGINTGENGEATVSFFLSDSVTSFRVMADGVSHTGTLGQSDAIIESRQPFFLEPRLPLEVTAGDIVRIPVSLVNSTQGEMLVKLDAEVGAGISLPADFKGELALEADERGRLFLPVTVGRANGQIALTLSGDAGAFSDRVTREIAVRPLGFPMSVTVGGLLNEPQAFNITIPDSVEPSSITTTSRIYPSPVANLMAAMERLIREPYG
jgi:alpha-2-macroglobulin-like protein